MISYRHARRDELDQVLDWAAAEGWNPGLDDAAAFLAADPQGFFVASDGDTPVAAISVVNHNDSFAFLGLYIVQPAYRGQGIGHGLWQHALDHAGSRVVGLDGVPDQQSNYAASGFVHAGATTRYVGAIMGTAVPGIRPARPDDVAALVDREAAASGARKAAYMSAWFQNTPSRKTLLGPQGLCTVRACRVGAKIGPLLADDTDAVHDLLHAAAAVFPGDIMIDVPDAAPGLARLCADLGLTPGFETARMYRGPFAKGPGRLFAVTTLELG